MAKYRSNEYANAIKLFNLYLDRQAQSSNENLFAKLLAHFYKLASLYYYNKQVEHKLEQISDDIQMFLGFKDVLKENEHEFNTILSEFFYQSEFVLKLKPFKKSLIDVYVASLYFDYANYTKCIEILDTLVEKNGRNPNDSAFLTVLVCEYKLLESGQTSRFTYEQILAKLELISLDRLEVLYHMSNVSFGMNDLAKAEHCIDEAISMAKKAKIKKFNDRFYRKGRIFYAQNNYEKALDCFKKQVNEYAQHFDSYAYMALCYEKQANLNRLRPLELLKTYDRAIFGATYDEWKTKRANLYNELLDKKIKKAASERDGVFSKMLFISYSWKYKDTVIAIDNLLRELGFDCWRDEKDDDGLDIGGNYLIIIRYSVLTTYCPVNAISM